MIPPVLQAPKPGEKLPLELRHYGESEGSISLYDDDGETFNYEKGNYNLKLSPLLSLLRYKRARPFLPLPNPALVPPQPPSIS